jgi:predicted transcriptional regulator
MSKFDVLGIVQSSYDKGFDDVLVMGVLNGNVHLSTSMQLSDELKLRVNELAKDITKLYRQEKVALTADDIRQIMESHVDYRLKHVERPAMTLAEWAERKALVAERTYMPPVLQTMSVLALTTGYP